MSSLRSTFSPHLTSVDIWVPRQEKSMSLAKLAIPFPASWKALLAFLPLLLAPGAGHAAQIDGDYVVHTVGNQFEWLSMGSGNTRWASNAIAWHYNPANAPANFSHDEILAIVNTAMAKWEAVCNVQFSYQGTLDSTLFRLDRKNVIGWSIGLLSGAADGLTESWLQGSTVVDADIGIWRDSPAQKAGSDKEQQRLEVTGIVTHELGHLLGLGHSDKSKSIMFANPYHHYLYTNTLRQDDIDGCVAKYGARGAAAPALTALTLSCPASLSAGATSVCTATGSYSDGTAKAVSASWSSSNPAALAIGTNGALTAGNPAQDAMVTITASAGAATQSATALVTVKAQVAGGNSERVFNWLESSTRNLFLPTRAATATYLGYTYRYYSRSDSILATKNGRLYYVGSLSGYWLVDIGAVTDYLGKAAAAGY